MAEIGIIERGAGPSGGMDPRGFWLATPGPPPHRSEKVTGGWLFSVMHGLLSRLSGHLWTHISLDINECRQTDSQMHSYIS